MSELKQMWSETRAAWHCLISNLNIQQDAVLFGWILGASTTAAFIVAIHYL